jgi:predicted ATPase
VTDDTLSVRHVRDALQSLHDRPRLQVHPLLAHLPAGSGGRALQAALEDAVGALRPPAGTPPAARAARIHRLLHLRYVDGLEPPLVWEQLGLSKSEYYREHGRGVAAVASVLAHALGVAGAVRRPAPPDAPPGRHAPAAAPTGDLPVYLTTFVGREAESAEVAGLLAGTRLLTLTGAGGCGKTRLAVHVAAGLLGAYPAGVRFVDLAPLADAGLVAPTVLASLGARELRGRPPLAALTDYLGARAALLVLDNCEHLVAACAHLAETVLRACPHARILATGRETLGVAGETVWRVPSLEAPDPGRAEAPDVLVRYPAVRLFVERARAVRSEFRLTDDNAPAVARVCQRLDGIPLAIELAAARVAVLTVDQIVDRLHDRFHLLTGGSRTALGRQQTLRAAVDWSHQLLAEPERVALRRLAVFAGGWTLEAAEAVCAGAAASGYPIDGRDVLDLLASLVRKSLVLTDQPGPETRYRLLETIRQYAEEQLSAAGELAEARQRHLAWCVRLAEAAEPELLGPRDAVWFDRLEAEVDNLRAALRWSIESRDGDSGLRLAGALGWFWYVRGYAAEARDWLARRLEVPTDASPAVHARALFVTGRLTALQGDNVAARSLLAESITIFRELNDETGLGVALHALAHATSGHAEEHALLDESVALLRRSGHAWELARSLHCLGNARLSEGQAASARGLHEEALALFRRTGNGWGISQGLIGVGTVAARLGDYPRARDLYGQALAIRRAMGHRVLADLLNALGAVARAQGDRRGAAAFFRESLTLARDVGDRWEGAFALAGIAAVADRPSRAVRLLATADAVRAALGAPLPPADQADYDRDVDAARSRLGADAFAAAWDEGRAMTPDQALAEALEGDTG